MRQTAAHPLQEADILHRNNFKSFVLNHAEAWHRTHLIRLYEHWDDWNAEYFAGEMTPPYLLLSTPNCPRALGDCSSISGFGGRSQIRLRVSLLTGTHPIMQPDSPEEGKFRFVADVLLHEMIHQWQQEVTGISENSYHGHGRTFRDKCNEIGSNIGLRQVGLKTRGGLPPCSSWPHSVRNDGYYFGAILRASAKAPESELGSDEPPSPVPRPIGKRGSFSEVEAIARYARLVLEPAEIQALIRLLEF